MTYATIAVRKTALTTWEGIWYVLQNIALGAGYFGKIPPKKAMSDFGLTELTGAEHFWYVLMCIGFGAGYFAKIPTAKALSELPQFRAQREASYGTLQQVPPTSPLPPSYPSSAPLTQPAAAASTEPAEPTGSEVTSAGDSTGTAPDTTPGAPEPPRHEDE